MEIIATTPGHPDPPYYVKGLALGLSAFFIGIHLWTWVFTFTIFLHGRADFRQLYTAGYLVRSGRAHQLYDYDTQLFFQNKLVSPGEVALPFIRPAYQALLFVPFAMMSYRTAYLTFLATNLALLCLSYRLLRPRMNRLAEVYRWLPAALFLGFLPIAAALIQGQDSILLLALMAAALNLIDRDSDFTAGILVGLGLFKLQIVIPIALLFLAWKRWRFCAGFALSLLIAGSVSFWLVGGAQTEVYFRSMAALGAASPSHAQYFRYPIALNIMPNLHGLIFGLAGGYATAVWITAVTVALSACLGLWIAARTPRNLLRVNSLSLAVTVSLVVSYYLFIHDLSVLLIPIVVTLDRSIEAEATGNQFGRRRARAAVLAFVSPVCMSYAPDYFFVVCLPLILFLILIERSADPMKAVALS